MPIRLLCPNCRQPLTVADHLSGKRINCPKCKNVVSVPAQEGALAPAPVAPSRPAPQPHEEDDLALNIPGQESIRHNETEVKKRCPGCGRDLPETAVLCTGCGHDFKTGQRRKGFEITDPEKKKRIFDSVVRNGFFLLVLIIALGGFYYAYKKGLFSPSNFQTNQKEPEKEAPPPPAPKAPPKEAAKKPTENKSSLVVVTNNRFSKVAVYADRERIGEAGFHETKKIALPPAPSGRSVMISFEAILPAGHKLPEVTSAAMSKGVPFSGTTQQGLQITFAGPAPDMCPAPDEVLTKVLVDLEVSKDAALNVGLISNVKYKDCVLKPVPPQTKLHLAYGQKDGKTVVKWLVQDVLIERSAKKAYGPAAVPYESSAVDLVFKNGVLDVKK